MNYFAHGRDFVDQPYVLAGTAVPDWLCVADRAVRVRSKDAAPLAADADDQAAAVAAGIVRHCDDDRWFHATRTFAELSLQIAKMARAALPDDEGMRPSFLGHILVELLLDAALTEQDSARLQAYYDALDEVDPAAVQATVNRIARRPTDRLALFIPIFRRERFLWDYLDDGKLLARLNQVMCRVKLPALPAGFVDVLTAARVLVRDRAGELLIPSPAQCQPTAIEELP